MLTELQKRKLTKLFSMYDATCDGVLVWKDFETLLNRFARLRNWSSRSSLYQVMKNNYKNKWEYLRKCADTSADREVCLSEWFSYYNEVLQDEKLYNEDVNSLIDLVFGIFDQDNDGKVTKADWGELLSLYNISPVYADVVFPTLDTDQDGALTKEEVLKLVYEFCHGNDPEAIANAMFGPY